MPTVFGPGTIDLVWSEVFGRHGLGSTLGLRGKLTSKGYPPGAAVLLLVDASAWQLAKGHNVRIGAATPVPVVIGYPPQQQYMLANPPPADECSAQFDALVHMESAALEGLEDCRQGGDFELQIETDLLLLNLGTSAASTPPVHYQVHPLSHDRSRLQVKRADWGAVLQQWNRGVGIPIVVSLPETTVDPDRSRIAAFLREAWQKVDGGNYQGAFEATRKSVELLRNLSPATQPIPPVVKNQTVEQRLHRVVQSLFDLASAEPHADGAAAGYVPSREDAVALVGASAALTQCFFARRKSP